MNLNEAKQILEDNGYEIAKADMNWRRSPRHIDRAEIVTVDYIDQDNYEDYVGKTINVKGDVDLSDLGLKELPIKFNEVGGSFYCDVNKLTSLEGCPKSVGGSFYCDINKLTSLEGCPKTVGGDFSCSSNELTSLEGCPKSVDGDFFCDRDKLTSLKGCPETVGGDFDCGNNKVQFTEEEVKELCDVKGDIEV